MSQLPSPGATMLPGLQPIHTPESAVSLPVPVSPSTPGVPTMSLNQQQINDLANASPPWLKPWVPIIVALLMGVPSVMTWYATQRSAATVTAQPAPAPVPTPKPVPDKTKTDIQQLQGDVSLVKKALDAAGASYAADKAAQDKNTKALIDVVSDLQKFVGTSKQKSVMPVLQSPTFGEPIDHALFRRK